MSSSVVLAHSSDLHMGEDPIAPGIDRLERVIRAAITAQADVLLLAGDVFDNNRQREETLLAFAGSVREANIETVILPGNHDCLVSDSVYRRLIRSKSDNLHILGLEPAVKEVYFQGLELLVVGKPHMEYADMCPVPTVNGRQKTWQVAMVHGHLAEVSDSVNAWQFTVGEIEALPVDYVAMGHWDQIARVSDRPSAWYSGAAHHSGTINIVTLSHQRGVVVELHPVVHESET